MNESRRAEKKPELGRRDGGVRAAEKKPQTHEQRLEGVIGTWLGHYYRATIGGGSMDTVLTGFRSALEANQELRAEAEELAGSFDIAVLKRCHISRTYKEGLERVLADLS